MKRPLKSMNRKVNLRSSASSLLNVNHAQPERQINAIRNAQTMSDIHTKTLEKLLSMRSAATEDAKPAINKDIETLSTLASTINDLGNEMEIKKYESSNFNSKISEAEEKLNKIEHQVEKLKSDKDKQIEENEALLASMKSISRMAQVQLVNEVLCAGRNASDLLLAGFRVQLTD